MQRVDVSDLDALLHDPFLHEDLGAAQAPVLVVSSDQPALAFSQTTISALRALPAVCVAVLGDAFTPDDSAFAGFDLILAPGGSSADSAAVEVGSVGHTDVETALGAVGESIAASPQAAVTLAQLLRLSSDARVRDALIAESLAYSVLQTSSRFREWLDSNGHTSDTGANPNDNGDVVDVQWTDRQVDLIFNRPARHNAFNARLRDCFVEAVRAGLLVPDAQVVVSGRGPSFCSGGDLGEFGTTPDPATAHHVRSVRSPAWWVHQGRDRISFELHGACYGAGIELPAFANRVIADPGTRFCLPEVAFGLIPGAGGTVSLPRRIGRQRTAWLALTGVPIGADTALAWGLVDELAERRPKPPVGA